MASIDIEGIDSLMSLMESLGDTDSLCMEGMTEAQKIVEDELRSECQKHHETGAMAASIKATGPKKNQFGLYDFIRPTGKDSKGVRNMEKLAALEYGTVKQVATPVCASVASRVEEKVTEKLQEPFTKAVEKVGI